MNILTNIHQKICRGALRVAVAAVAFIGAAEASAACTVANGHYIGVPVSQTHEGFSYGERIKAGSHRTNILKDCVRSSGADLSISPSLAFVGEVNGIPTFATASYLVGAQFRYRYIEAASWSTETWSSWFNLGATTQSFHAKAIYNRDEPLTGLPVEVEVIYVALADIPSNLEFGIDDLDPPFELEDNSYGQRLEAALALSFSLRPVRYAYCHFSAWPPSRLNLARTHTSLLDKEGAVGPATDFSFAWQCAAGDDRDGGADFQFISSKALGTSDGLLGVDGDAKGVDMLVTMKDKAGNQMPIPLGTHWWASYHYHRGTALPDSGRQEMQVRFRRNKDEIKPGNASSTLTVHLSLF
ncbi:TPA: hypothetical protein ACKP4S_000713 [Stenotrophomonas maltophilia]